MRFLAPEDSVSRGVCILCERPVDTQVRIFYPPSMEGGLVCEECWSQHNYIETSRLQPASYVSDTRNEEA